MTFKPYFINHNMYFGDKSSIKEFQRVVGNSGNSYITHSFVKLLYGEFNRNYVNGIDNIYSYNFSKNQEKDLEYINSECSHVIFILQDQIRKPIHYLGIRLPFEELNPFIRKIKVPIIVTSLGLNSFREPIYGNELEDKLIDFLNVLSEKCKLIGVRGYDTEELLNSLGIENVQAVGCPSFFKNGRNKVIIKKEYNEDFRIATTPDYFNTNLVTKNYEVIYQDEFHLTDKISTLFSDIDKWEQFLKTFDFFLGTRLHGSIASINAGLPAVVINPDYRVRETCKYLNIPNNPDLTVLKSVEEIYNWADFYKMNEEYDRKFDKFMNYLNINTGDIKWN